MAGLADLRSCTQVCVKSEALESQVASGFVLYENKCAGMERRNE